MLSRSRVRALVNVWMTLCVALVALLLVGCGTGSNAASQVLKTPELPTDKQAKCKVAKSQAEPLIVEWPDAARARLESVSRRGLVAVHYEGCELAVLQRCTVKSDRASYVYSAITRKQSTVQIKDADELYASMPVGAVRLESKLQSAGELDVAMTIVGRYETSSTSIYREELEGECGDATHVIAALTVGSFTFSAGSDAEVGAGATSIVGAGGGGKSTAKRQTLEHDGDETACVKATIADKSPPEGCGALLQIEVMPLTKGRKPVPVVAAVVPTPTPTPAPTPASLGSSGSGLGTASTSPSDMPPKPAPKCKKGEHAEDGKCVKGAAKVVAVKPKTGKPGTKGGIGASIGASTGSASASFNCVPGQHSEKGQCVDDEKVPEREPPPPPPPPKVVSCIVGSHLENGACVIDAEPSQVPEPYVNGNPTGPGQPSAEAPNPWRTLLIYLAVGGGVSTVAFGYAALNAAAKVSDGCPDATKTCTPDGGAARGQAKGFAIISDVSLGVTAASLIGFFLLPSHVKVGAAPTPHGVAATAWWQF